MSTVLLISYNGTVWDAFEKLKTQTLLINKLVQQKMQRNVYVEIEQEKQYLHPSHVSDRISFLNLNVTSIQLAISPVGLIHSLTRSFLSVTLVDEKRRILHLEDVGDCISRMWCKVSNRLSIAGCFLCLRPLSLQPRASQSLSKTSQGPLEFTGI